MGHPYQLPHYKNLLISSAAVCRERYKKARQKYDKQFLYELKMQEAMQYCAYDAMRFHRHFVITTLWPPLHTRKEIDYTLRKMNTLSEKQQKRLKELMSENIV